jgi:hypothetical protein
MMIIIRVEIRRYTHMQEIIKPQKLTIKAIKTYNQKTTIAKQDLDNYVYILKELGFEIEHATIATKHDS